jgi:amino acid adenylation domain-containing protein/non-ribosomal peptide synthase protein (TIGR01720 family)
MADPSCGRDVAAAQSRPRLGFKKRPAAIPLSFAQQRMWFINRLEEVSPAYNMLSAVRLTGQLDEAALRAALGDVSERQESLRTVFPEFGGDPRQEVLNPAAGTVVMTVTSVTEEELPAALAEAVSHGFDVSRELPWRVHLFRIGSEEHVLLLVVHHIAGDGWSVDVLASDVSVAYAARKSGCPPSWQPLPVHYADYALWQRELLGSPDDPDSPITRQLAFWRSALAGLPGQITLPTDRPRPPVRSHAGGVATFRIGASTHRGLAALARQSRASLFMLLHAGLTVLISRLGAGTDIPVGTSVVGRDDQALDGLVGLFINTIVLRADLGGNPAFADLVRRIRAADLEAYAHQGMPFQHLVEVLAPERSLSRHPLFQVLFAFQNAPDAVWDLPGLRYEHVKLTTGAAMLDLSFSLRERRGADGNEAGIDGILTYAADLFDARTAESIAARLVRVLDRVAADPLQRVSEIEMLDPAERWQLAVGWNDTVQTVPTVTLPELFEARVADAPDAVAVACGDAMLTYAGLDAAASRLARLLISRGAGPERVVAVAVAPSVQMAVAVLAVLKAGAAYLAIDLAYPAARIDFMIADARPVLVATTVQAGPRLVADHGAVPRLVLDDPRVVREISRHRADAPDDDDRMCSLAPRHPAYVVYTSGSTGAPKGVVGTHAGLVNRLVCFGRTFPEWQGQKVCARSPLSALDASVELLGPLLHGQQVVLADETCAVDPRALAALIARHQTGCITVVPHLLATLAGQDTARLLGSCRFWMSTGEALTGAHVQRLRAALPRARLLNRYGSTEAGGGNMIAECDSPDITIGAPTGNTRVFVLDAHLGLAPPGVTGELYVAGAGLARAYLRRPGLTAGRFVACPFGGPGERMYRSGDLAKWTAEGRLVFAGRTDGQVQLRGFRVELGEIEALLASHEQVGQAVVIVREDQPGHQRLVAYVVAAAAGRDRRTAGTGLVTPPDGAAVRRFVAQRLPDYMVPAAVIVLDALPLLPSGKLDKAALPVPDFSAIASGRTPGTAVEEVVCSLFAEILGLAGVGADDSFFELGGDSLLAMRLIARIGGVLNAEIGIRGLFAAPTPAGVTRLLADPASAREPARRMVREGRLPLSFAQTRMWFLNRLEGGGATYNIPLAVRLSGELDEEALQAAVADVAGRHESLRTVFPDAGGVPWQQILDKDTGYPVLTVTYASAADLPGMLAAAAGRGFDVSRELPWRAQLLVLSATDRVLVLVVHHIAADGWSMGVIARDLSVAYAARLHGRAPEWTPLPLQYADYTLWQREQLGEEDDPASLAAVQLAFWRQALDGIPQQLELPMDRPRPAVPSCRGGRVAFRLAGGAHAALVEVARQQRATLFMVLQAGLAALLTRLGAGTDIPIGAAVAGRGDEALAQLAGFFVNTLVLRTDLSGDPGFADLVSRAREADLSAFAHQDLPFERLVEALAPERSLSWHPLFQVMVAFQNTPRTAWDLPGLQVTPVPAWTGTTKFDISVSLWERRAEDGTPAGLDGVIDYSADLFDSATVEALAQRLRRVLEQAAARPDLRVGELDVVDPAERRMMVRGWNDTAQPVPEGTLAELFEARSRQNPDSVAVTSGDLTLSYALLDGIAQGVAQDLVAAGAGPEKTVAVLMERSAELVIALLAVVKSGAAYLPLHPTDPVAHLQLILQEARPSVLAVSQSIAGHPLAASERAAGVPVLIVTPGRGWAGSADVSAGQQAAARRARGQGLGLAYMMYTSGSTGAPKGVAVTHKGVAALAADRCWSGGNHERVMHAAPHAFDASTYELWVPLLAGGTVVVAPSGNLHGDSLRQLITERGLTAACIPAGLLRVLAYESPRCLAGLREVLTGGDVLSVEAVAKVAAACPATVIRHTYGPTEVTLCATAHEIRPSARPGAVLPIGAPMDNMQVFVLDEFLRPVPPGVTAELYVAGAGVARGYIGQPGMTAERFVACPFGTAERMYRTGDLARWTVDGQLAFAGRADNQVKIRGFRVELGQVQTVLARHPEVGQAVVVAREDVPGQRRLVAYVVPVNAADIDGRMLREHVASLLPDYMVPAAVVELAALPLTRNGKLDRAALPPPGFAASATSRDPCTPAEEALCLLFAQLLGVDRPGADDSFFDLGGDSITSIQLVARARNVGLRLTPQDVFVYKTPAALASAVGDAPAAGTDADTSPGGDAECAWPQETGPTPVMCALAERAGWGALAGYLAQSVLADVPAGLGVKQLTAAVQAITDRHGMLRARLDDSSGGWRLVVPAPGSVSVTDRVRWIDVSALEGDDLADVVSRERRDALHRLDPGAGVMAQVVWFDAGRAPGLLLVAVHHLATDGVSWRILLPDLAAAWRAIAGGELPQLGPAPTSFSSWAGLLAAQAHDPERVAELPKWSAVLSTYEPPLGNRPLDPQRDTVAAMARISLEMSAEKTAALVTKVPAVFAAGVHETLLAGLAAAVAEWRARDATEPCPVHVDVESHGREQITPGIDLSRTVGWFTSVSPAQLDPGALDFAQIRAGGPQAGELINRVRDQLRSVPSDGLGYGLLRYLNPDTAAALADLPAPQIGFNYLGRFTVGADGGSAPADGGSPGRGHGSWQPAAGDVLTGSADPGMAATHVLEAGGVIRDLPSGPQLSLSLSWPREVLSEAAARELAEGWLAILNGLAAHATAVAADSLGPSHTQLVALTQDEVEEFEALAAEAMMGEGT